MFVLWLRNQRYYACDIIGIKMTHRIYPTTKLPRPKHSVNINFTKNKHKNHANSLHTFRKWPIAWSQFVLSRRSKHCLIRHSMASTAIYRTWRTEPGFWKCEENQSPFLVASYQVSLCCYSSYLAFPLYPNE